MLSFCSACSQCCCPAQCWPLPTAMLQLLLTEAVSLCVYVCIYTSEIDFILLPFLFSSEVGRKCAELGENQLSRVDGAAPL